MTSPAVELRTILKKASSSSKAAEAILDKFRLYRKDGPVVYKPKICALESCGAKFVPIREWQDYHTISCRQKAYRERKKTNGV